MEQAEEEEERQSSDPPKKRDSKKMKKISPREVLDSTTSSKEVALSEGQAASIEKAKSDLREQLEREEDILKNGAAPKERDEPKPKQPQMQGRNQKVS